MLLRLRKFSIFFTLLLITFSCNPVLADFQLNLSKGVTPISKDIYELHMTILWICVGIGIGVFSVMFYAMYFHRKSRGAVAADFHESTKVEIVWTIIPLFILIAMAWPATKVLVRMENSDDADLTIKVTGYMWKWHYDYLGQNVRFMSNLSTPDIQYNNKDKKGLHYLREVDNNVVVPINKKIRFLTTANDVIHSWYVPELGIKKDAVPGFINETWAYIEKPGIYRGQCAELCGARHGYMPIVVEAKTQEDYDTWLQQQKEPKQNSNQTS